MKPAHTNDEIRVQLETVLKARQMFFISNAALPEIRRETQREWRKLEKMVAKRARGKYDFDRI